MIAGALALMVGFLIDPAGEWIGLEEGTVMLTESALFVYASYILPNDARRYLEAKGKSEA